MIMVAAVLKHRSPELYCVRHGGKVLLTDAMARRATERQVRGTHAAMIGNAIANPFRHTFVRALAAGMTYA